MRALKIAGAAIAAMIVVAALLLIVGVPSGFLTSEIQTRVERETGYKLTIAGATRIGIWPSLNVKLNDVTLQDPKDRNGTSRLTVGSLQADVTLSSLWSGRPQVTELVINKPLLQLPLLRERSGQLISSARPAAAPSEAGKAAINRVTVTDGVVVFSNLRDRVENRIDGIDAEMRLGADRKIKITGAAKTGGHPLKFDIRATAPQPPLERQNIPVEIGLDAPSLLQASLAAKAEVRLNGSTVMINGLSGTLGDGAFNGWASVDLASKPLVKLDLDFQRLDTGAKAAPSSGAQAWSNATFDISGLNYVDAQVRASAAEFSIAGAHFAPAAIDATLGSGVLKVRFSNLGAYGGQASGEVTADAAAAEPSFTLRSDLAGVRALPLLTSTADFDKLDGKMQAKISVRATGSSQRAIMANLNGTAFVVFQDGAIIGLNVAKMIRSLTSGTLSGWQEKQDQVTDLSQLSASFRIDKGQAVTTDLNLVGPLVKMTGVGTIDLGTRQIAFRVDPKLVMTTEGQGRASDPVGLGIPVMIDGPWAQPRIYPDMAGILDNPDAAYAKLKEMGKGLFGKDGGGLGGLLGGLTGGGTAGGGLGTDGAAGGGLSADKLGETLGNLIQQGLGLGLGQAPPGQGPSQGPNQVPSQVPSQGRSIPAPGSPVPAAPQNETIPQAPQDSPAMNDVLRQLFNR
ncbi:AsmA family protein [Bradyrhizobium sediminis]|uniref:AsmA family protein n=1 Tax=Bradyrhizobium sediminis TaxID=2840469 RepID=A0A975RXI5_9BRAD|nr:AsmA family protein [Bradyrhizobium sediminis]QWG23805.1 AsmA family protein [Bradyrhizobium sediminis]